MGNTINVLYLDFSKALDRVSRYRFLLKLRHLGIRGNLLAWIEGFLLNRTFQVKVGKSLRQRVQVLRGVPQGSVLGPLFFLVYTDDLKNVIKSSFVMYANDIKLYT